MKQNIVLDFTYSDIVRFFRDNMDILSVDINNINLDDPESIIYIRLVVWHNRFKEHKEFFKS